MAVNAENVCYKISSRYGSFNIEYDYETSSIILWNKFKFLIYYSGNFTEQPILIMTDSENKKILIKNYQLLCLDHEGNIHFRNIDKNNIRKQRTSEKLMRTPKLKEVITCEIFKKDYIVSVLLGDDSTLLSDHKVQLKDNMLDEDERNVRLFINKFTNHFDFVAEFKLKFMCKDWVRIERGKSLIVYENIKPENINELRHIFDIQNNESEPTLFVISLDTINVYMCLIHIMPRVDSTQYDNVKIAKLHKSDSEIVGIHISVTDKIYILLGLVSGIIVKIPLINSYQNTEIYPLYSKLYKFTITDNTIFYTDGLEMWKTEYLFSKTKKISKQFIVQNVKDFCIIANRVICTTFLDFLYCLYINSDKSYKPINDNCCPVNLVTNSHCLHAIKETVKENDELCKVIEKEKAYLAALSLSKRQNIMDSLINVTVNVYDNYYEILKRKITELILTDELSKYNDTQSYFFVVRVSAATVQHKLNKLISGILGDVKIHVTIKTMRKHEILKTTSIRLNRQLKKENFVISLKRKKINTTNIEVHIKIITNMEKTTDKNRGSFAVLYQKNINLNTSNFIITPTSSENVCLKDDNNITLDELICEMEEHSYGNLYNFNIFQYQWLTCVMLPRNNVYILTDKTFYENHWDLEKIDVLLKPNMLGQIYSTKKGIELQIGLDKVILTMDGSCLWITSPNIYLIIEIRKMFSDSLYSHYKDAKDVAEYVDCDKLEKIEELKSYIMTHYTTGTPVKIDENLYMEMHQAIFRYLPI